MNLYTHIARSHFGSSLLFAGFFFVPVAVSDGLIEAAAVSALAACAWFASYPVLRRLIGAVPGA